MPGYREITVPGEGHRPRRAAPTKAAAGHGDWRAVLGGLGAALAATCRNSPGTVLGSVVAVGAAGFVCYNALGHQSGRHPAPILPKVEARKAPTQRVAAAAPEAPSPEAARPAAAAVPKQAARDAIGDLIRSDETTASVTPRTGPAKPDKATKPEAAGAGTSVMQAQRALSKLGYGPIKADGTLGPTTRAAIEKFERGAKLPVTGEAAGKTLRALVSRAGQG